MSTGRLYVVATPIGNLGDISRRALEVLGTCRVIACEDTRRTRKLLTHYGLGAKLVSYHEFNERARAGELLARMRDQGLSVALVSDAGTPAISDPGYRLVRAAREAGIAVLSVPGPSAVAAGLAVSGLPSDSFAFFGFVPRKPSERRELYRRMRRAGVASCVLYESARRIRRLCRELAAEFPDGELCLLCDLTKLHEKSYFGPAPVVAARVESDPEAELGEYTIVAHIGSGEPEPARRYGLEAELVETMLAGDLTLRAAVQKLVSRRGLPRNQVYRAALNLRSRLAAEPVLEPDR